MDAIASAQSNKIFMEFFPANNFCQFLRVTRKRSCTSAGNAQAQLHFRDDQQRAFGISNISSLVGVSSDKNGKMANVLLDGFSLVESRCVSIKCQRFYK